MKQSLLLTSSLAAFVIFTGHSVAEVVEPRGLNHPMRQTLREMDQVRADAEEVLIRSRYCLPPGEPQKQETRVELEALQARLNALRAQVAQYERTFNRAGQDDTGKAIRAAFPPVNGIAPPDHGTERESVYWSGVNKQSVPAQDMINKKRDALRRASEEDCRQTEPSRTDIVVQLPLPPTPPPPPPEPPKERLWDPMAGLVRPELSAADLPVFPQYFCSEAEKQAMLARIDPAKAKAQRAADANEAYAQQIEARKAQLTSEGMPLHWQNSMDYAAKNARFERDSHLSTIRALDGVRKQIEITPVVDCTTKPPKDELKTGWNLRGALEYGTGKIELPDAGYLGVENPAATQRINSVIRAAQDDSGFRRAAGHLETPINWAPPNLFAPFGGRWRETRLRAGFSHSSADAVRFGSFNPMGDTLFFPGLSNNIADTVSLPSTFNATLRDNRVDDFRSAVRYRQSELFLGLEEDLGFAGCDDFTLTKTFGFQHSWTDRRDAFRADVRDYFPVAFPNFNVRSEYNSWLDSSTTALKLGLDGTYAPESWSGFYISAGADGWVGNTKTDGSAVRVLDINGGLTEQRAQFKKSETTRGFGLRAGVGYDFGGGTVELGVEYRKDGDSPTIEYGAGVPPQIGHSDEEYFLGTLRTTFKF
jgi:hypothetical protein